MELFRSVASDVANQNQQNTNITIFKWKFAHSSNDDDDTEICISMRFNKFRIIQELRHDKSEMEKRKCSVFRNENK